MREIIVKGIHGYLDADGMAYIKLEDAAFGLGMVKIDRKNGTEYKRIHTQNLKKWIFSFGLLKSENDNLPEYIPEPVFYLLAMKATNEVARKFQNQIAYEILPAIRKKGFYGQISIEGATRVLKSNHAKMADIHYLMYGNYGPYGDRAIFSSQQLNKEANILLQYRLSCADIAYANKTTVPEVLRVAQLHGLHKNKSYCEYYRDELRFSDNGMPKMRMLLNV